MVELARDSDGTVATSVLNGGDAGSFADLEGASSRLIGDDDLASSEASATNAIAIGRVRVCRSSMPLMFHAADRLPRALASESGGARASLKRRRRANAAASTRTAPRR